MPPSGPDPAQNVRVRLWPLALGLGVVALGGVVFWDWKVGRERGLAPQPAPPVAQAPATSPVPQPAAAPQPQAPEQGGPPAFDIVRINPRGDAVIAGRAAPGMELGIRDGDREIGRARADAKGNWVFLSATPLPPGARELSVVERTANGEGRRSEGAVLLVVPEPGGDTAGTAPLAVLSTPGAAPRMLQGPPEPAPATGASSATPSVIPSATQTATPSGPPSSGGASPRLGLEAVDYDAQGDIRFAGTAPPGAALRLYVDNQPVGEATADPAGRWTMAPPAGVSTGDHRLRLDQVAAGGQVSNRIELPFRREAQATRAIEEGRVVVQPGQSLWVLARQMYGQGTRYTVIYSANKDQIRDPRLIYPGQTFTVPR